MLSPAEKIAEQWYATENRYAGGWLITAGTIWEPGHPNRVLARSDSGEIAEHIVADHNAHLEGKP